MPRDYEGVRRHPRLHVVSPADPARRSAIVVCASGSPERDTHLAQALAAQKIIVAL
jgi:hypothetical protein